MMKESWHNENSTLELQSSCQQFRCRPCIVCARVCRHASQSFNCVLQRSYVRPTTTAHAECFFCGQGGGRNDTICLRNLSEHVTEHNLREFMHQVDGYVGLHFINKSGNPLCFVKLESVESADMAIQSLEGRVLPGGDNAIRAEPAKRSLSLDPTTYAIRN